MIISLSTLIKQRISVPELVSEKKKNYLLILLSLLIVGLSIGLTFFKNETLNFTFQYFGIIDNILYTLYMLSSLLVCFLSFSILNNIDTIGIPIDQKVVKYKKTILYTMFVNIMLYLACLVLVSYYKPTISYDKLFISFIFFLKEINSIFFLLEFMLYNLSLKYDLMYLHMNLNLRPDLEYFMESEKINFRSML
jgi:hypothetical protein